MTTKYKHLEIENFVGEPTSGELEAIEQKLGVKLPAEFVDFLKVANGGHFSYLVDVWMDETGETEEMCFGELYGTKKKSYAQTDESTFLAEISNERLLSNAPPEVLPIATNGLSILYLDLTVEGAGRVVAFVYGLPEWTGRRQDDAYIEIAKSFSEYVDKLYLAPDDEQQKMVTATE